MSAFLFVVFLRKSHHARVPVRSDIDSRGLHDTAKMTTAQNGSFSPDLLDVLDVLIVGAGPCGLAVAARLQEETPSAIFTDEEHQRYHWIKRHSGHMALVQAHNKKMNGVKAEKYTGSRGNNCCGRKGCQSQPEPPSSKYSTLVLDGSGDRWMERWNRSFRTLEIEQLRSPMFFHVDPGDRDGMLAFTMENGREKELWEIPGCVGQEMSKHKKKKRTKARYVLTPSLPQVYFKSDTAKNNDRRSGDKRARPQRLLLTIHETLPRLLLFCCFALWIR